MSSIEVFENITNIYLPDHFQAYIDFIEDDYPSIVTFYKGDRDAYSQEAFATLDQLIKDFQSISNSLSINRSSFKLADIWDIMEEIDTIRINLRTVKNSAKWLRSSYLGNVYTNQIEFDYVNSQGQTVEKVASSLGYVDAQNKAVDLALKSNLREEDFKIEGGSILKAALQNNIDFTIEGVVDTINSREKTNGKDINAKFSFSDNDLAILSYEETLSQAVNTVLDLKRGDVPEFPEDGMQTNLLVGSNINSAGYPILFRQLFAVFSKDDTLRSLSLLKLEQVQDAVHLQFSIAARSGEFKVENVVV